jgi:hypothetical protein
MVLAYPASSPTSTTTDTIEPTEVTHTAAMTMILLSSEIISPHSDITHTTAESSPQPDPFSEPPSSIGHPLLSEGQEMIECQLPSEVMVQGCVLISEEKVVVVEGTVVKSMIVEGVYERVCEGDCGGDNRGDGEDCLRAAAGVDDRIDLWMKEELATRKEENPQLQLQELQHQLPPEQQQSTISTPPKHSPSPPQQQQQSNNIKHRQRQRRQQVHTSTGHIHKFA